MTKRRECVIDLSEYLSADVFDRTLRAVERIIENSEELSLDDEDDKQELIERLFAAFGVVD